MSYRDVFDVFKRERKLADDETALLIALKRMTIPEREALRDMLVEILGPPMRAKVNKVKTTRNIEHCAACDYTRRAAHHKEGHKDYHEFVSSKDSGGATARQAQKSARASSLASAIKGTAGNHPKPLLCDYEIDGKVCKGTENDGIHDKSLGYGNYHPFVSSSTARNAVGQSSTSDDEASSETGSEDVSVAAGG